MRLLQIALAALAVACLGARAGEYEHARANELGEALRAMQQHESAGFVIVDIPGTEKYFQYASGAFIGSEGRGYVFDVPTMSLAGEEIDRAGEYFSPRGVEAVSAGAENPETGDVFYIESYQKRFDAEDIESGVQLGVGFMFEVLQHRGDFVITRGWE